MSFWTEVIAQKGSTEVVSSLLRMIFDHYNPLAENELRTLVIYSDRCPGQNNNKYFVSLMMFLVFGVNMFTTVRNNLEFQVLIKLLKYILLTHLGSTKILGNRSLLHAC